MDLLKEKLQKAEAKVDEISEELEQKVEIHQKERLELARQISQGNDVGNKNMMLVNIA